MVEESLQGVLEESLQGAVEESLGEGNWGSSEAGEFRQWAESPGENLLRGTLVDGEEDYIQVVVEEEGHWMVEEVASQEGPWEE